MNGCPFAFKVLADMLQGFSDRLLGDDVRVEGQVNGSVFQSNIVPVGQESNAAELVFALESPDAGDRDSAGTSRG